MTNHGSLFRFAYAGLDAICNNTYARPGFSSAIPMHKMKPSSLDYGMRRDVAGRNRHPRSVTERRLFLHPPPPARRAGMV